MVWNPQVPLATPSLYLDPDEAKLQVHRYVNLIAVQAIVKSSGQQLEQFIPEISGREEGSTAGLRTLRNLEHHQPQS